ncbi:MAG: hypothetical protein HN712_26670 [Gemmatimonadetes bacterium]|jgi:hypothetical protein|nr:hypothetical protein [Gemmatimonadota bacterium]MBT6144631.1 hypothetical protein [Gemmatimonadota bacterium]MBT7863925.1 hypothetical protein [Gemmatimonadota bacterium]
MTGNVDMGIRPSGETPRYWQYRGQTLVLLGGSDDDNLFQMPDVEEQLDLLAANGGNFLRNTMSDRPDLGYEIKAFGCNADGVYDLATWNDEYWDRFERFLEGTHERGIIVQIELWDRFDHSMEPWQTDPFNPKNNVNYDHESSGLAADYPDHPCRNGQPFFYTVPELRNNQIVLPWQQAFIDRVLSLTLQYDHVLYCVDNETSGDQAWARYWADYITARATAAGAEIHVTEMWDHWDVRHETHRATFDDADRYRFVDISQNSQTPGEPNWHHAQWVWHFLRARPRPMNSTKIYGADTSKWTERGIDAAHGTQTFWRNLIGGFAAMRFHRPPSGHGLGETARRNLRAARSVADQFDFMRAEPDSDHRLINERQTNEAYMTRVPGKQYAIYYVDGGLVGLDLRGNAGRFHLDWFDIDGECEHDADGVDGDQWVTLAAPGSGPWVALLTLEEQG